MSLDNQENIQTSVKVAVRIRPLITREQTESCAQCIKIEPDKPQLWLGKDKAFTYDHVFGPESEQTEVYETCVKSLVEGCFSGYNATVFAYGQTGSGKTYSMGIGFEPDCDLSPANKSLGIVPRAVYNLFEQIESKKVEASEKKQLPPEFKVKAQFIELYNEEIIDLLDSNSHFSCNSKNIRIQGENGTISLTGVTTKDINSVNEAFECLRAGSQARTTASTQMNSHSSRSHAIFTLTLNQTRVACETHDVETLDAKFHFVDLAGSERLKKTGATGERAKEAISINSGLLCLGNVISALDKSRKTNHVPYRNSKLTRLLQDSLGGNSRTLMIACIAPTDRDYMESLSTLRYANRAKNIENKIVVNQDTSSHIIASLRRQVRELKAELMELKQGKRVIGDDGAEYLNDIYCENSMLLNELQTLRSRNKALQEANDKLANRQALAIAEDASPEVKQFIQKYFIGVTIGKLRNEVSDIKKQKVNVMNKLKEEANKHRNSELQNAKRIAQLIKQERLKEVKIKNLELENARLRQTLKRRDAEVKNLKNETKNLTARSLRNQNNNNQQQQPKLQPPTQRRWNREAQYVVVNGTGQQRKYWNSNYKTNNSNSYINHHHNSSNGNGNSIKINQDTKNINMTTMTLNNQSQTKSNTNINNHHLDNHRQYLYNTYVKRKEKNLVELPKDEFYSNNITYNRDRNTRRLSRTPQELYFGLPVTQQTQHHPSAKFQT